MYVQPTGLWQSRREGAHTQPGCPPAHVSLILSDWFIYRTKAAYLAFRHDGQSFPPEVWRHIRFRALHFPLTRDMIEVKCCCNSVLVFIDYGQNTYRGKRS